MRVYKEVITGFQERNYFSRYFKKRTGKTPRQFRKQQLSEDASDREDSESN